MDGALLAGILGDGIAATAVSLASWQLVRSRKDLREDRHVTFYLEQLVAMSDAITGVNGDFGKSAPAGFTAHARLLPPWLIPRALLWTRWEGESDGAAFEEYLATKKPMEGWGEWIRAASIAEIATASDGLTREGLDYRPTVSEVYAAAIERRPVNHRRKRAHRLKLGDRPKGQ